MENDVLLGVPKEDAPTGYREWPKEVQDFSRVTLEMNGLYRRKNRDYGNSFGESYREFGLISALVRMSDKWRRLKTLAQQPAAVAGESLRDTLIDLACYCVMTVAELDKEKIHADSGV